MAVSPHIRIGAAKRVLVDLPLTIVRDEQVQAAVVIVVEPSGGDGPHLLSVQHRAAHAGFVCNIRKGAVVVVMKQLIPGYIGEKDVRPAVVVVVSDGDADAVALALHSGALGNIGVSAVAVIVEQAVPILRRLFLERWDGRAVDEVNVQVAVVVVIEERHAGEHGLGQVLIGRRAVVRDEMDARTLRDFLEGDGSQGRRRRERQERPKHRDGRPAHLSVPAPSPSEPCRASPSSGSARCRWANGPRATEWPSPPPARSARVCRRKT